MIRTQTLRQVALVATALAVPTLSLAAHRHTRPTSRTSSTTLFRHSVALRSTPALQKSITPRPQAPRISSASPIRQFDLQPAGYTPYDPYLSTVRQVLWNVDEHGASLGEACRLLRVAHSFTYVPRDPYRADPPSVTAAHRAGDCKSKALWLYDQLGDSSALYVIGKVSTRSRAAHAWLYWRYENQWWILDPTNLNAPISAQSVSSGRYIPYYSFTRTGAYRHPATHLLLYSRNQMGSVSKVAERKGR